MEQREFEHIAVMLREKVLKVAVACGIVASDAEDCAQDAMLKLWALHDDIADSRHAEALATIMAKRLAIDTHRRRRDTIAMNVEWNVADGLYSMPDKALETAENERWLTERLSRLPKTEYEILRLRQTEHKETAEIAAILGLTPQSVSTLLSRARRKMLNEIRKRTK